MNEQEENTYPRVSVTFTKSSTKDGGSGFTVQVQQGVSDEEAHRVFNIALALRSEAEVAIAPRVASVTGKEEA